ncbi:MAG: amino acid ABC transporter permease [Acidiferrobacterales bacterium]
MNPHLRFDVDFILRHLPDFIPAVTLALQIFSVSLIAGLVLGVLLAIARLSRTTLSWFAGMYIEVYRNTPLLVQLYFVFFGLPVVGIIFSPFMSGVIALGAQHAAFFAEILRGNIQAVSRTQQEAALALGMMPRTAMRLVILPQAIRNAIPAMGSQFVLLLHDTSLVSTIGILEITLQGRTLAERSAASLEMFVAVGAIYLLLSAILSLAMRGVEQAYRYIR